MISGDPELKEFVRRLIQFEEWGRGQGSNNYDFQMAAIERMR